MKKFLLSLALACAALSGYAQLADNQRPVGTYYTDVLPSEGVGNPSETGKFTVLTTVSLGRFNKIGNAKIVGMRFGLNCPIGATKVHVRPAIFGATNAQIFEDVATANVLTTKEGWNYAKFAQPLDLRDFEEADAFLIGYDYTQTNNGETDYPLLVNDVRGYYSLVFVGALDGKEGIYDFSPTGSLCAQLICEGDIPDYDIVVEDLIFDKHAMAIDAKSDIMVKAYNYGLKGNVRNVNFDILIDGEKVQTLTQRSVETKPLNFLFSVPVPESVKPGVHKMTVKATSVGNDPITANLSDDAVSMKFTAVSDNEMVERDLHLVEHFTSVDCMWCPRGTQFLQELCQKNPKVTVVSIHGNMGQQDPYCTEESNDVIKKLGIQSYPGAAVNRIAFDDGSYSFALTFEPGDFDKFVSKYNQYLKEYSEVCIAPIQLSAMLTEDGKTINIDIDGAGSPYLRDVLSDCVLNVYVVENGLVNRQKDENGATNPFATHNNVMRRRVTEVDGNKIAFASSSTYHNNFKVPVSDAWKTENMEVVAFITRVTDNPYGRGVINATRVPVSSYAEGIEAVSVEAAPAVVYDLSGRVAQPSVHGVFLQNGKKVIR